MKQLSFSKLHPFSVSVFFMEALCTCFLAKNAGLLVMLVLLFIYALVHKKAKTLLWSLPLAVFMLVLNPLFYHGGETVLFSINGVHFTLEAVQNGIYCALLILCTILCFTVLGNVLSEEKFLYVFGRFLPKTALMISMIFRHFDLLSEGYRQTQHMASINGCYENDRTLWQKLKTNAVIFEAFSAAALEGSIDTALSLGAKGYYSKNKTRIKSYRFHWFDFAFMAVCSVLFALTFLKGVPALIATGLFFLLPLIFDGRRDT